MELKIAEKIKIKWMHSCSEKTDWENRFLYDIEHQSSLTPKQKFKLDEIYRKWRRAKGKSSNKGSLMSWIDSLSFNYPFCEKHGVSYDDIHDFAK